MISTKLRLRELLVERRWTTKTLAKKAGLSESYLTHLKNGTRRWNEDTLMRLSIAFEMQPTELFFFQPAKREKEGEPVPVAALSEEGLDDHIPIFDVIPAHPGEMQTKEEFCGAGFSGYTFSAFGEVGKEAFCLRVKSSEYEPLFSREDVLVISPSEWSKTGDIVATEFYSKKAGEVVIALARVSYLSDFILVDCLSKKEKRGPFALIRGKDQFRVIGKVVARYQKY